MIKYKTVRAKGEGMEYLDLRGKVIKHANFVNDDNYTALNLEFADNTLASFRLNAKINLCRPEIARLKDGNLIGWKKLKAVPGTLRIRDRSK